MITLFQFLQISAIQLYIEKRLWSKELYHIVCILSNQIINNDVRYIIKYLGVLVNIAANGSCCGSQMKNLSCELGLCW